MYQQHQTVFWESDESPLLQFKICTSHFSRYRFPNREWLCRFFGSKSFFFLSSFSNCLRFVAEVCWETEGAGDLRHESVAWTEAASHRRLDRKRQARYKNTLITWELNRRKYTKLVIFRIPNSASFEWDFCKLFRLPKRLVALRGSGSRHHDVGPRQIENRNAR